MTDQTPSRRAGLRDDIAAALEAADYSGTMRRGDLADSVMPVLYREWPWLRAEADEAGLTDPEVRAQLHAVIKALGASETENKQLRARVRNLAGRIRQGVPWTANDADIAAHILRALDEDQAPAEPPAHIGRGANAEDCPACKGTNPDYPFICPGPDAEQPERTTVKNPASDYEQTTGHAITCGAGFSMGCQCGEPADLTGYLAPEPSIGCLAVTAEPDPFGYEERERTGRNAGLVLPAATEATDVGSEFVQQLDHPDEEAFARVEADLVESGVDTPGCDCGHDGMGVSWHGDDCPWRHSVLNPPTLPDSS